MATTLNDVKWTVETTDGGVSGDVAVNMRFEADGTSVTVTCAPAAAADMAANLAKAAAIGAQLLVMRSAERPVTVN